MTDIVADVTDANESADNIDIEKRNENNATADPQSALRLLRLALLKHLILYRSDGTYIPEKMGNIIRRFGYFVEPIGYFVEPKASEKALRRVMCMWKFGYKIKSKWKRCDKTATCMHSPHLASMPTTLSIPIIKCVPSQARPTMESSVPEDWAHVSPVIIFRCCVIFFVLHFRCNITGSTASSRALIHTKPSESCPMWSMRSTVLSTRLPSICISKMPSFCHLE